MSIGHAILLLNAIDDDYVLRQQMYNCANAGELMMFLKTKGYQFTIEEFEESVRYLHVKCQRLEEAQHVLNKAEWLRYQLAINEKVEV